MTRKSNNKSSGRYTLAHDINSALEIKSDNVMLSLNSYRITVNAEYGIKINNHKQIYICDGTIGPDNPEAVAAGIKINNTQDVYLENCNIINTHRN